MVNIFGEEFNHKICRYCGQIFNDEADICESCTAEFARIESELKSHDHSEHIKHCAYCGKPFIGGQMMNRKGTVYFQPTRRDYCRGIANDDFHYCQCQSCGNAAKASTATGNWPDKSACSRKCINRLKAANTAKTCQEKYGANSPFGAESVKAKVRQTNLERYGVESYLQKGHTREIADAKMRAKYGVESNISQNPEIRKKIDATMEEKYGGYLNASAEFREHSKQVCLEKYGVEYPNQAAEIRMKTITTNQQKRGVENVMQDPEVAKTLSKSLQLKYADTIQDPAKRLNYLSFCEDPVSYILNTFDHKPTIYEVQESLAGFDASTIYFRLGRDNYTNLLSKSQSVVEKEVQAYIESIDNSINIYVQNRNIIHPWEIDLYLTDYRIGIEVNPTYTHNSSVPAFSETNPVTPIDYHKMKSDLCEQNDVFLFHIFGYEWTWKQEIIKSMIRNLLGKSEYKYYARKLVLDANVDFNEAKAFLDSNHRQGATSAKVRLGLRNSDGELLSLMTFNKMRHTMGSSKTDTDDTWELSRFCSKLNCSIVGGASKLFAYFKKNYQYDTIVSFSDRAHTRGSLYQTLGFHQKHVSDPSYVWVDLITDIAYSRVSCQKKNLPKLLGEPDLDIVNQTEKMIMSTHGFVQVFDAGTVRWEYTGI